MFVKIVPFVDKIKCNCRKIYNHVVSHCIILNKFVLSSIDSYCYETFVCAIMTFIFEMCKQIIHCRKDFVDGIKYTLSCHHNVVKWFQKSMHVS